MAMLLVWVLVLFGLVTAVLAVVFSDELVDAWAGGSGLSADDTRVPPSFSPVVVVLYVVLAGLILVLMALMALGNNWARFCMVGMGVVIAVGTAGGLRAGPPALFVACSAVVLLVDVALVVALLHPQTDAFFRPTARTPESTPEKV